MKNLKSKTSLNSIYTTDLNCLLGVTKMIYSIDLYYCIILLAILLGLTLIIVG